MIAGASSFVHPGREDLREEKRCLTLTVREALEEATREYVERLKEAYPGINERELYDLVYQIALRRVVEAEGV